MGHNHPFHNDGSAKRRGFGTPLHLSAEEAQSRSEGQARQRVPSADCRSNVGK